MAVYLGTKLVSVLGGIRGDIKNILLQEKSIIPSETEQNITADDGYDALNKVTVSAISSTYIGSDITKKESATYIPNDDIQTIASGQYLSGEQIIEPVPTQTKTVTSNGTVYPDAGKYLSSVDVNVSIEPPSLGTKNITNNGTFTAADDGYTGYSEVTVNVPSSGIDTSDANATASDIAKNKTAYVDGEKITGSADVRTILGASDIVPKDTGTNISMQYSYTGNRFIIGDSFAVSLTSQKENFGNATAEDVAEGKTFTSAAGLKVVGTHVLNLQSKSVTPTESSQIVSSDSGYDGLSNVSIKAIPSTYIGSAVTKKSAATYTPNTSTQTIASGQYLEGNQTISAVPTETKEITANGTYTPTSGKFFSEVTVNVPSSGGGGTDNCEAYHITSASDVINFQGSGTVKVWGYGASRSSYTTTMYAFVGDGYYKSGYYGTPTKTTATFSIASDGTLSGLPSLSSLDLIVEIGV